MDVVVVSNDRQKPDEAAQDALESLQAKALASVYRLLLIHLVAPTYPQPKKDEAV